MAKKGKYTDKEYDVIDRYKKENQKLKEQISKLRKQLSRIDLDRYNNIKDLIDQTEKEEPVVEEQKKDQENAWLCFNCEADSLRMVTFERRDGIFYYRKCNNCNHRTKTKKITPETKPGPS